jgi:membrane fusion protein (multidrug efflux system)
MNIKHGPGKGAARAILSCAVLCMASSALAQAPKAPPPPQVTVMEIQPGKVELEFEHAARVAASREVQVRAQAGGILMKRNFVEGELVKAGDVLFEINPELYQAELAKAEAQLRQAEAQSAQASRDAERMLRLFATGSGTEKSRDDALSAKEIAAASEVVAQAQVKSAQLNLAYTKVAAPIDGVTGQEQVAEGSLIGTSGDAGLLTRITQRDPVHINFAVTEREMTEVRNLLEAQGKWERAGEIVAVKISFGDGQVYGRKGVIDFAASGLDTQTGTLRVRAVVANPEHRLLPGQFVRATVTGVTMDNTMVVPHAAVQQNPQGKFVYTVNSQGNAEIRPVTLGREVAAGWIVESGLKAGDRIVTEGIIKVRPGAPVTATPPAGGAKP